MAGFRSWVVRGGRWYRAEGEPGSFTLRPSRRPRSFRPGDQYLIEGPRGGLRSFRVPAVPRKGGGYDARYSRPVEVRPTRAARRAWRRSAELLDPKPKPKPTPKPPQAARPRGPAAFVERAGKLYVVVGDPQATASGGWHLREVAKPRRWQPGDRLLRLTSRGVESFSVPHVLTKSGQPDRRYRAMRRVPLTAEAQLAAVRAELMLRIAAAPMGERLGAAELRIVARFPDGRMRRFQSFSTFAALQKKKDTYFVGVKNPYEEAELELAELDEFGFPVATVATFGTYQA